MTRFSHVSAPNSSAAPPYELTTVSGGGCAGAGGGGAGDGGAGDGGAGDGDAGDGDAGDGSAVVPTQAPHQPHSSKHQDPRKRKDKNFSFNEFDMMSCDLSLPGQPPLSPTSSTRKRKGYSLGAASAYDDDCCDDARSSRTLPDKKQNHSEIEKRRRDKMNTYITELSAMIPMCGAMARKLDKLTVLRMAVQHLRSVRGALSAGPLTARPRPAFLTERELNALVLLAAQDCFLLVVGCDRGRLLYASASVEKMLHYDQSELLSQSLFDILHPKDVAKVKEQLSSSDLSPRERLIDAKTMLPVKADPVAGASRLCPGARRSFFCRIKCKSAPARPPGRVKEEDAGKTRKKKYCVVQCTGYLKLWAPMEMSEVVGGEGGDDGEGSLSCLVAVGRALTDLAPAVAPAPAPAPPTRRVQFVSRHAIDGKFLFVDQRVTLALGFLPQELLGTSLYEYVGAPELGSVARVHKAALLSRDTLLTPPYGFRRKDGTRARVQTHFKPFKNPWTKDVECLVANNTILSDSNSASASETDQPSYDLYNHKPDLEMQRLIDSQVESHKIGSAIADEALRHASPGFSPDLLQDAVFNQPATLVDSILGEEAGGFVGELVRNNVAMSAAGDASPAAEAQDNLPPYVSPPLPSLGLDGNGEAAMAVIMSLLEADAGLGGPVNFSGLPWPLP